MATRTPNRLGPCRPRSGATRIRTLTRHLCISRLFRTAQSGDHFSVAPTENPLRRRLKSRSRSAGRQLAIGRRGHGVNREGVGRSTDEL
jgi:hypothetical protein